jgi:hypothetical protein
LSRWEPVRIGLASDWIGGTLPTSRGGTGASTTLQAQFQLGLGGTWKHVYTGTSFTAPSGFRDSAVSVYLVVPAAATFAQFSWNILNTSGGTTVVPSSGQTAYSIALCFRASATTVTWVVTSYPAVSGSITVNGVLASAMAQAERRFTSTVSFHVFGMYIASSTNY